MAEMTQARVRELFNYDPETGSLTWRQRPLSDFQSGGISNNWHAKHLGKEVGGICSIHGYRRVRMNGREWRAHRIIWLWVYGSLPEHEIDHINGKRADNRLVNLRSVSHVENMRNAQIAGNNTSGRLGVSFALRDNIWRASIGVADQHIHLGNFATLEEACAARKAAEIVIGFHPNHGRAPTHKERRRRRAA